MKTIQVEAKNIQAGDMMLDLYDEPISITEIKIKPHGVLELHYTKGGWISLAPGRLVERVLQ